MAKHIFTICFLVISNIFMTFAWYGHLKFGHWKIFAKFGSLSLILISWLIAFFEYCFLIPANKIGYKGNEGPYSLFQLKVLQEVITLTIFTVFTLILFKTEQLKWNHIAGFTCLILAVFFMFKK